jgi:hypothetical protein
VNDGPCPITITTRRSEELCKFHGRTRTNGDVALELNVLANNSFRVDSKFVASNLKHEMVETANALNEHRGHSAFTEALFRFTVTRVLASRVLQIVTSSI